MIVRFPAFAIQNKIIKDDMGFNFILSSPPQRIISLAPNITEILFALDLDERVVGVTRYCDFPEEAINKEKIGGMIDPNIEKIKSLNPDLVVAFRGNSLRILKRLREINVPVFVLEMGTNIESVFQIIEKIGAVTSKKDTSERLIKSLKERYVNITTVLQDVHYKPKVFISLHGKGLWTCGKESFLNDLISKAKGINIAGEIKRRWILYNREELIHANPEIIIILSKSQKEYNQTRRWIKKESYLESTRSVANDKIYFLDQNITTRPGPRIIDALECLARILHPHCFQEE